RWDEEKTELDGTCDLPTATVSQPRMRISMNCLAGKLQSKAVLRLTHNVGFDREQSSRQPIARCSIVRCGCDVQSLESRSSECARSHILYRHFNHAINFPVWSHTDDTAAKVSAVPQISLGVHGGAIRQSPGKIFQEWTLIRDVAGLRIIVKGPDHVCEGVAGIKPAPIGTPSQRVGDADVPPMNGRSAVSINAVKHSVLAASFS